MKSVLIFLLVSFIFPDVRSYHFRRLYPELTTLLQSDVSGNGDGLSRPQRKLLLILVNNDEGEESHYYEAIRDHKVAKRFEDVFETALGDSDLDENMKKYLLEIQKSLHSLYSVSKNPTNIDRQLVHSSLSKIWSKYDQLSTSQKTLIRQKAPEFLQLNSDGDHWLAHRSPAQIYNEPHQFSGSYRYHIGHMAIVLSFLLLSSWLLDNFGDSEDLVNAISISGIHPYILLYQFFVLEFFLELDAILVFAVIIFIFGAEVNFILIQVAAWFMFFTMMLGCYILYTHNLKLIRWFSVRIKMIYLLLFIWGFAGLLYLDTGVLDRITSAAMLIIAIVFALEDKALIQVIYFETYRYTGI